MQLAPNFTLSEFLSENDKVKPGPADVAHLRDLAQRLQVIRDLADKPMAINSGYRSKKYNAAIGGASESYHTKGMAADIPTHCIPSWLRDRLWASWSGGMGKYKGGWIHLDTGPHRRWEG